MKGVDVWQEGVLVKRKTLARCTSDKKKRVTPLFYSLRDSAKSCRE
jgi:hypothetical protein